MNKLINYLSNIILKQIKKNSTNIIRVESFDNPSVYKCLCEILSSDHSIDSFVAKLALEKYIEFKDTGSDSWSNDLDYLHQGSNELYSENLDDDYKNKSYVDFNNAITKWRNESASDSLSGTSLILLLGTEAATDIGGLIDTSFVVSPKEIIEILKDDFSLWFENILDDNGINSKEAKTAIHTLYRAIFTSRNVNLFKFSSFIDQASEYSYSTVQELIEYICESLCDLWDIPSIFESESMPKFSKLAEGQLKSTSIIQEAVKFIDRFEDIPTERKILTYKKQFENYAKEKGIDVNAQFVTGEKSFTTYNGFRDVVIDYLCGKNIDENRNILLKIDYAIINHIFGTKLPKETPKVKIAPISGDPIDAIAKVILDATAAFKKDEHISPTAVYIGVDKILLSNCVEEQKADAFLPIASFMGGIVDFINESCIENDGTIIVFGYSNAGGLDPFDYANYEDIKDIIKCTGKWGDPCKINLTVNVINGTVFRKYEYKWVFSPNTAWPNAFSYLCNAFLSGDNNYVIPSLVVCDNMQDYIGCESEEEFYAQLNQIRDSVFDKECLQNIQSFFKESQICVEYELLRSVFNDFTAKLVTHGLFNSLTELRSVVEVYSRLMTWISKNYNSLTDVQREKISLVINCFMIFSNKKILESGMIDEAIIPAYNPVMLEKLDAQQLFIREGFSNLMNELIHSKDENKDFDNEIDACAQMSSITQGVDTILQKTSSFITCKNIWEYFAVYYNDNSNGDVLSGNAFGSTIVTDDEDASVMLKNTPMSSIIVRNVVDYLRTFPARIDGIQIAFIAPTDMQHIVSAIHQIAKHMEENDSPATLNIRIVCINNKKNSSTYLKTWLDSYFNEERTVRVNTFLRNITVRDKNDVSSISDIIKNHDICFTYNLLEATMAQYAIGDDFEIDKDQPKFPMTFTPDTIASTHGKTRRVNISQFQFLASKAHSQATHSAGLPDSKEGIYRAYNQLELSETQELIVDIAHNNCKWVVCIDPAIDRRMLESHNNKIIGFTTGEGCYGELNVTVSARSDILSDIKDMLKKRITEKFKNWDEEKLKNASEYCVDKLSSYMDGSRILKALNPYDYEIHSFLAYILTLQILGLSEHDESSVSRSLISLDSYKHWFAYDDNMRPDFMLLRIPKSNDNFDPSKPLFIEVKIIECKMGFENSKHKEKAQAQLEKGLRTMIHNWDPDDSSIMHRYWLNQLYRAIIFTPIGLDNTTKEYEIIRNKIYNILNGKIQIQWTGDVFAFWLDSDNDIFAEYSISDGFGDSYSNIESMTMHEYGQMFIQRMLLPPSERGIDLKYNYMDVPDDSNVFTGDTEQENEDATPQEDSTINQSPSIPQAKKVYLPFLRYLCSVSETGRQDTLKWFDKFFELNETDKSIVFESNGHKKWETVVDFVITDFRKYYLLENSSVGHFHATPLANNVLEYIDGQNDFDEDNDFFQLVESVKGLNNNEIEPQTDTDNNFTSTTNIANTPVVEKTPLKDVRVLLGKDIRNNEEYYWEFGNKELNNRHLLINGNSGCGKTYCIQTLLYETARQGISSVVFDYTGGFANSKLDPAFKEIMGDRITQRIVKLSKIPVNPFAKHEIQIDDDIFVPEDNTDVADKIAEIFKSVYSLGDQQRAAVYMAVVSGLKKYGEKMSFSLMVKELDEIGSSYSKSVISKIQAFADFNPFDTTESFNWSDIRESNGQVYVIQLSGYGREIQVLLTELLLWDIWSFCVKTGDESKPFILVLDEAQNLSHGEKSPSAKILTEGRKFGISGWYATQFMKPQLTDDEIQRLQQAGQKLYFCPPDEGVLTVAKNIDITSQGTKEWSEKLKKLKKGECVTCGNMIRNNQWSKYNPRVIKVTSFKERIDG